MRPDGSRGSNEVFCLGAGGWGLGRCLGGGLGGSSAQDIRVRYEFDYWSGDALLRWLDSSLIATADLKAAIHFAGRTGVSFDRVEVSKSEQVEEFCPEEKLPAFAWVKVEPGKMILELHRI
jgi:hypothetical protein